MEPKNADEAMAGEYEGLNWRGWLLVGCFVSLIAGTLYGLVEVSHWLAEVMSR